MSGKKTLPTTTANPDLPALKIGSRVRCTDDGVAGRIVWANATSVKITWDDGEQVTWRRDSLAGRPIEIIDVDDEQGRPQAPAGPAVPEEAAATDLTPGEPETPPATAGPTAAEPALPTPHPAGRQTATGGAAEIAPMPMKPKRRRPTAAAPNQKLSALDAAAKVLAEEGRALNCQEMIEAMAAKGYWTSPGGKTPAATLYSAILRELANKGAGARFVKTERGKFARSAAV
jgi:hypothetical protein